jgi:hypothetical protein
MKAYTITEPYERYSVVIFHEHAVSARRIGAASLDLDFGDVECRRSAAFDQFAPGPVPSQALWDAGWWFECDGCSSRASDGDGTMIGERVYCDECQRNDPAIAALAGRN